MSDGPRYTRLASSDVLAQVHVTPDSRFILLPLIEGTSITGWVVYDTGNGMIVEPDDDHMPEGYKEGVFPRHYQAKTWVNETYYRGG